MTDAKRRGGWPGDARPIWPFRADKTTQDAVTAYIAANGLDPKRGRSAAINALAQAGAEALGLNGESPERTRR